MPPWADTDKGTTVELKKEQMIRIVSKWITLDFTELKSGIRDNLAERFHK